MTDNPFEALGAGGFDMNALLQQAQQMQQQLEDAQQRLHDTTVEGSTAGGLVRVTLNGVGELTKVDIDPGAVDTGDAGDLESLGDLVVAAYRDAKTRADALAGDALGPLAGGLGGGLGGLGGGGLGGGAEGGAPGQLGFGGPGS